MIAPIESGGGDAAARPSSTVNRVTRRNTSVPQPRDPGGSGYSSRGMRLRAGRGRHERVRCRRCPVITVTRRRDDTGTIDTSPSNAYPVRTQARPLRATPMGGHAPGALSLDAARHGPCRTPPPSTAREGARGCRCGGMMDRRDPVRVDEGEGEPVAGHAVARAGSSPASDVIGHSIFIERKSGPTPAPCSIDRGQRCRSVAAGGNPRCAGWYVARSSAFPTTI
jgi:hypothetical protein